MNYLQEPYFTYTSRHFTPHGKKWTQEIDVGPNVWLHSTVGRASHRYCGGHLFESRWSPDFFRLLRSNCLNWTLAIIWSADKLSSTKYLPLNTENYKLEIQRKIQVLFLYHVLKSILPSSSSPRDFATPSPRVPRHGVPESHINVFPVPESHTLNSTVVNVCVEIMNSR